MGKNSCQLKRDASEKLNVSQSTVNSHREKLDIVNNLSVSVPHNINERKTEDRVSITSLLS